MSERQLRLATVDPSSAGTWRTIYSCIAIGGKRVSVSITPRDELSIQVGDRRVFVPRNLISRIRTALEAAEEDLG